MSNRGSSEPQGAPEAPERPFFGRPTLSLHVEKEPGVARRSQECKQEPGGGSRARRSPGARKILEDPRSQLDHDHSFFGRS